MGSKLNSQSSTLQRILQTERYISNPFSFFGLENMFVCISYTRNVTVTLSLINCNLEIFFLFFFFFMLTLRLLVLGFSSLFFLLQSPCFKT
jgi:hypothetical protein